MAQELKAQAAPGAGPGDQTWDVGHRVRGKVTGQRHAEVRHEGGERVVCDLGLGRAEHRDQRGLTRAGKTHQRHIRDGLEFQDGVKLLPRLTELREPRGLAPGGGQPRVAATTAAATGEDQVTPNADQVRDLLAVRPQDDSAVRHRQHEIHTVGAVPVGALTRTTARGPLMGMEVEVEQGRHARVDPEDDVPATTAVAAVRAAERFELLAMNRGAAIPAIPCDDVKDDPVDEGGHSCFLHRRYVTRRTSLAARPPWNLRTHERPHLTPASAQLIDCRRRQAATSSSTEMMLMTRRPRRVPNWTCPATSANSVSSLPRPTCEPGWKCVPRWRTMISPALTY